MGRRSARVPGARYWLWAGVATGIVLGMLWTWWEYDCFYPYSYSYPYPLYPFHYGHHYDGHIYGHFTFGPYY